MKFQSRNVHYLRVLQELMVISMIILEAVQVIGYGTWFYEAPSHGSTPFYWLVLFISFVTLLYFLSNFPYIWKNGPYKYEIYIDIFLTLLWSVASFLNILIALTGGSLNCNYPEDNHDERMTRCRLFLSSMSLGWIMIPTYMISSYISIMRWSHRPIESMPSKYVDPPVVAVQKPETYRVQKGVLSDGQPVLLFHMAQKNTSSSNLSTKGSKSGSVTPTRSDFTSQGNSSRVSIYLHDQDITP